MHCACCHGVRIGVVTHSYLQNVAVASCRILREFRRLSARRSAMDERQTDRGRPCLRRCTAPRPPATRQILGSSLAGPTAGRQSLAAGRGWLPPDPCSPRRRYPVLLSPSRVEVNATPMQSLSPNRRLGLPSPASCGMDRHTSGVVSAATHKHVYSGPVATSTMQRLTAANRRRWKRRQIRRVMYSAAVWWL